MFYYARSFGALLFFLLFSSFSIFAQNQSNLSQQSQTSGLETKFYVDEAGLQLIQTASPLDQFIDPKAADWLSLVTEHSLLMLMGM